MKAANRQHRIEDCRRLTAIIALSAALALAAMPAAAAGHKSRGNGKQSGKGRVEAQRDRGAARGPSVERRGPQDSRSRGEDRGITTRDRGRTEGSEWRGDARGGNSGDRGRTERSEWNGDRRGSDQRYSSPRYPSRPAPARRYIPYEPRHQWVKERWYPVAQSRPQFYCNDTPYYEHVRLGIYFPRFWFNVSFVDAPPPGCAFYDPYCDVTFWSIGAYRAHLHGHSHSAALDVVVVNSDACDPYWEPRPVIVSGGYGCDY